MKHWFVGCTLVLVLLLVFGAGCAGKPPVTPTPTPTTITTPTERPPVITAPTRINPMEPQPTDFVPNSWTTILTVSRNPSSYQPDIIVTYGGGTGQYMLQQLQVIVTHPDGSVQTGTVTRSDSETIPAQTQIVVPQTVNEEVRVQVIATYNGTDYSVYDEIMPPH